MFPYTVMGADDDFAAVRVCGVEANDDLYFGFRGGTRCAVFDMVASFADEDNNDASGGGGGACDEEEGAHHGSLADDDHFDDAGGDDATSRAAALVPGLAVLRDNVFHYTSCENYAWAPLMQFSLLGDAAAHGADDAGDDAAAAAEALLSTNLVFEVTRTCRDGMLHSGVECLNH